MNFRNKTNIIFLSIVVGIIILSFLLRFRVDLSSDKRFSLSEHTKLLVQQTQEPIQVIIYLDGELNPGFLRLKNATVDILDEMSAYANSKIDISFVNPSNAENTEEREKKYAELANIGLQPTAIYERDGEGNPVRKIVFPWLQLKYNNKTEIISLLKNISGNSGEENLNISIENLEYELTNGLRKLMNTYVRKIAFIEGHGELNEAETYDISKTLSNYFQVDRGVLGTDATILTDYKVIIVAKPTQPFSESDKYIIDQYIMNGGRVLWLIDAVRIAKENLSTSGLSPSLTLDLNLDDLFFKYGVRINPVLLQDVQCATIPMNIAKSDEKPHFEPMPWFYSPLLMVSNQHAITKNISEVKADFSSTIDLVNMNPQLKITQLLVSSDMSHIVAAPATIDLNNQPNSKDKDYFNAQYLNVSVLSEGLFSSNFENRMMPSEINKSFPFLAKSISTRQIFVSDGDIIRNETNGIASDSTTLSLGFDRFMNQQFGNKDFIKNAVLYLAGEDNWLNLRTKTVKLRLLNKTKVNENELSIQILMIILPILLLILFGLFYQWRRKRKFTR